MKKLLKTMLMSVAAMTVATAHADTDLLTQSKGWQKVENLSDLQLNDYYFAFVDRDKGLMLSYEEGFNQSSSIDYKTMVYRTAQDVAMNGAMLWTLERVGSLYMIKNAEYQGKFIQTEWNNAWFCRTHDNGGGDNSWGLWNIQLSNGAYTIQNGKYPEAGYIGPWVENDFSNGAEVAANKPDAYKGNFYIYAIRSSEVMSQQAMASEDNPLNITHRLTNASARFNGTAGWTGSGSNTRNNSNGFDGKAGFFEFCNWNASSWTGGIEQTISSLPSGKYRVRAAGQLSESDVTLALVAGDARVSFEPHGTSQGCILPSGAEAESGGVAGWRYASAETEVTNGSLRIAFESSASAQFRWANIDNVEVYYLGNATDEPADGMDDYEGTLMPNDKVCITDGILTKAFTISETDGKTFIVQIKDENTAFPNADRTYYAFAPIASMNNMQGSKISSMIEAEQDYQMALQKGDNNAWLAARGIKSEDGTSVSFAMNYCSSVIDVDLRTLGVTPKVVTLMSNSGVSLAGKWQYDIDRNVMTLTANDATGYSNTSLSDVIRMTNLPSDVESVRFNVLPVFIAGGVTITVEDDEGNLYTKQYSKNIGTTFNAPIRIVGPENTLACVPYYKYIDFGTAVSSSRRANWMSNVPGNVFFTMLSLPGTHNAASKGMAQNTTETQSLSIEEQLNAGIRALDLRPWANDKTTADNMYIYHGSFKTNVLFKDALQTVVNFLDANPSETVFVLIHEEDDKSLDAWRNAVLANLQSVQDHIAVIRNDLTLSSCRGKMVIISRDDVGNTNLCGKCGWGGSFADKTVFYGKGNSGLSGWTLVYQDEYEWSKYSSKLDNMKTLLNNHIAQNEHASNRIYLNYSNTEYNLWSATKSRITTTANDTNNKIISDEAFTNHSGRFGIMFADYLGDARYNGKALLDLIISQNFKYLFNGRKK